MTKFLFFSSAQKSVTALFTFAPVLFLPFVCFVTACDMFIEYGGEEGLPCLASSPLCEDSLVCHQGVCVTPLAEGQYCETDTVDFVAVCEEGTWCVDRQCVAAGNEGQPCFQNESDFYTSFWRCNEHLTCIQDVCVPAGAAGLPCYGNGVNADWYLPCDDETLRCINDICTAPSSDTVVHPVTGRIWMRCPAGMEWNGWNCSGEPIHSFSSTSSQTCPDGFSLPSASDFLSLFSFCDAYALQFLDGGHCLSCEDNSICAAMFTKDIYPDHFWTASTNDDNLSIAMFFQSDDSFFQTDWEEESTHAALCIQNQ